MKYQDLTTRVFTPRASLLVAFMMVGLLTAPQSRGQLLQGTIDGNVTDASQAAVVNAQVRATFPQAVNKKDFLAKFGNDKLEDGSSVRDLVSMAMDVTSPIGRVVNSATDATRPPMRIS